MDAVRYAMVDIVGTNTDPDKEKKEKIEVLVRRDEYKKSQIKRFGV
jgi:hypothetical protein